MDILLCWSKKRSRLVARALHDGLPNVLSNANPWMSELDIDKGADWSNQLHELLQSAKAVVVCVTQENVRSPWLYYECGQIAGQAEENLICPFLLDGSSSILSGTPFNRFQQTMSDDKEDTFRLFKSLNARLGSREEEGSVLGERFEQYWGELSSSLERIRNIDVESTTETTIETEVDILAGGDLSDVAREMLLQIGQDQRAHLLVTSTSGGHHFQANGRDLNAENFPRSTARFREGLRKLLRWKLLEMRGGKGEVFTLTDKGFTVFDKLKDEQNID